MNEHKLDFDIESNQEEATLRDDLQADIIADCLHIVNNLENWNLDLYNEEILEIAKKISSIQQRISDNLESD